MGKVPRFTAPLTMTQISARIFRVKIEFEYYAGKAAPGVIIKVPEGYRTDLASVPRVFWSWIPPFGKYSQAAVVHDHARQYRKVSTKTSDRIFLEAMKLLKVHWFKRTVMFAAVRIWSWF